MCGRSKATQTFYHLNETFSGVTELINVLLAHPPAQLAWTLFKLNVSKTFTDADKISYQQRAQTVLMLAKTRLISQSKQCKIYLY